ncbi:MAG: hypothetical protein FJ034_03800, partial [Chloroflexi bacterium]|nr:hypothetical protein [Chloroflexota bacterium]
MKVRDILDATPLASLALALMREATGRDRPLEPFVPARLEPLPARSRVGFWSLVGGVGGSTTAALTAHRATAAGRPTLLLDLDRWAPSVALRAGLDAATVADALLAPGRERELVSRWSATPVLPARPGLHAVLGPRAGDLVTALAAEGEVVVDLGSGADALEPGLLASLTELEVVTGTRAAQINAAFCSVALLA